MQGGEEFPLRQALWIGQAARQLLMCLQMPR